MCKERTASTLFRCAGNFSLWENQNKLSKEACFQPNRALYKHLLSLLKCEFPESPKSNCAQWDFPGGAVVKNPPANAQGTGSSTGPGRTHMPWSN